MRREHSRTVPVLKGGAFLLASIVLAAGCGGATDVGEGSPEEVGQVQSAYTDGTEPGPLIWVCDLPINPTWEVHAPYEADFYVNECLNRTDYNAEVECLDRTGRGCCGYQTWTRSYTYSNQTYHCQTRAKGWRHL